MTRIFHLGLDLRESAEEMQEEHLALVKALYEGDPDRAEQLMHSQIARSKERVLDALTRRLGTLGQPIPISPLDTR